MRHQHIPASLVTLCSLVLTAGAALPPRPDAAWEKYQVISRNNVFLRDRHASSSSTSPATGTANQSALTPEQSVVLTGIVREDDRYVAFTEDLRTRATTKIGLGDAIGTGRICGMTLDHIDYENGAGVTRVEIGKNLEGGANGAVIAIHSHFLD